MKMENVENPCSIITKKNFCKPTELELVFVYFLLGIYVVIGSDSVIINFWNTFILITSLIIFLLIGCRLTLLLYLIKFKLTSIPWGRWLLLVFAIMIMVVIIGTDYDFAFRVWLSEKKLYEEVHRIQSATKENQQKMLKLPNWVVGSFNVHLDKIDNDGETIWFQTGEGEKPFGPPSLKGGIVYCNKKQPPERGETTYNHLYGPWWSWVQDI